jgi:hypothetical protein
MSYYYFSEAEKKHQSERGLPLTFVLSERGMREFTTTTDKPIHSIEHKLVCKTELY